jgi:RNA polymerase sigma-70 factor (ECF subfamily)
MFSLLSIREGWSINSRDAATRTRSLSSQDDLDLAALAGLRDGDPAALDALMARHWSPLVAYARRLLGNIDAAEDFTQEAFVRLWERRAAFRPVGSVRCYLFLIVGNLIRDEGRKGRVRARSIGEGLWLRSEPVDPIQLLEAEELRLAVDREIQALPARRREAFVLAHFHDLTYRQVAEVMGISPQTVANQVALALAALRHALAPLLLEGKTPRSGRSPLPAYPEPGQA